MSTNKTTNLELNKPDIGSTDWGTDVNENWDLLDSAITEEGKMTQKYFRALAKILAEDSSSEMVSFGDLGNAFQLNDSANLSTVTNVTVSGGLIAPTSSGGAATDLVPALTSNTSASTGTGFSFTDGYYSTNDAYLAFDSSTTTYWNADNNPSTSSPNYLGFVFNEAVTVASFQLTAPSDSYYSSCPSTIIFEYSTDTTTGLDGTWTEAMNTSAATWTAGLTQTFTLSISISAKGWRLKCVDSDSGSVYSKMANFKIWSPSSAVTYAASTIISTTDTAESVSSNAMGILWLDAMDATVTDATEANNAIRLYLSRDGGSTYDWMPLEDDGVYDGDVRRYVCDELELAATSGTDICWKVTSHDLGDGAPDFELHKVMYLLGYDS